MTSQNEGILLSYRDLAAQGHFIAMYFLGLDTRSLLRVMYDKWVTPYSFSPLRWAHEELPSILTSNKSNQPPRQHLGLARHIGHCGAFPPHPP